MIMCLELTSLLFTFFDISLTNYCMRTGGKNSTLLHTKVTLKRNISYTN